jgi:hypothetical protein
MFSKKVYILVCCLIASFTIKAQGVVLSQPFMSSQFLSSASVGNGLYGSRMQSNIKTQMIDGQNLYKTMVVGFDTRFNSTDNSKNYLGIGGQLVSDQVMNGVMQFNTLSLNFAYHIYLDDYLYKNVSLGIGTSFNETSLNRSKLRFEDQYDYAAQLTGNASLENLVPNPNAFSANASALYTQHDEYAFVQVGFSSFFIEKPNVTFSLLNSAPENKYRLFSSAEIPFVDAFTVAMHGNFLYQKTKNQYNVGASIGVPLSRDEDEIKRMYFGFYYRENEAFVPTVSLISNKIIFGVSYDIFNANKTASNIRTNSYELSLSTSFGRKKNTLFRTIFD